MKYNYSKMIKILSFIFLILLLLSVIPLSVLGFYNHPLGDDYYYGQDAKIALSQGGIASAIHAAIKGVNLQYHRWQGTYSAMFLMYLPPHVFSMFLYKLYPTILLAILISSIFFFSKVILCDYLHSSKYEWLFLASLAALLWIEQVPVMGETFYWYNGSMYYTGFFALSLFFFGEVFRYLKRPKTHRAIQLTIVGFILAGGNYTSLLPSMIILALILLFLIIKKYPKYSILCISLSLFSMLSGFLISALAPGNKSRQVSFNQIPAMKAILKSLIQGLKYIKGWSNIWLFISLILITPIVINILKRTALTFPHPLIVLSLSFGIFASASCPTFYAQNSGGPARAFNLSWYMMILLVFGCHIYLTGWFYHRFEQKKGLHTSATVIINSLIIALFFVALLIRPIGETYIELNSKHAAHSIISGDAKYYNDQFKERMRILDSSEDTATFSPYKVPESLRYVLYLGDISTDQDADSNKAYARFFGKISAYIIE